MSISYDVLECLHKQYDGKETIILMNELIDAVESNPELLAVQLKEQIKGFSSRIEISRCPMPECYGAKLKVKIIKDPRPYQDHITFEEMTEWYCQNCGRKY